MISWKKSRDWLKSYIKHIMWCCMWELKSSLRVCDSLKALTFDLFEDPGLRRRHRDTPMTSISVDDQWQLISSPGLLHQPRDSRIWLSLPLICKTLNIRLCLAGGRGAVVGWNVGCRKGQPRPMLCHTPPTTTPHPTPPNSSRTYTAEYRPQHKDITNVETCLDGKSLWIVGMNWGLSGTIMLYFYTRLRFGQSLRRRPGRGFRFQGLSLWSTGDLL